MKNKVIILLGLFTILSANAQVRVQSFGEFGFQETKPKPLTDIVGSPYLEEVFQDGVVIIEGKGPLKIPMRYNVREETFEVKQTGGSEIYTLNRSVDAVFELGDRKYLLEKHAYGGESIFGYFVQLFEGKHIKLVNKPVINLSEPVRAKTGYDADKPARMSIEQEYYIVWKDGRVKKVEIKEKDLKKLFDSKPVKDYLAEHKIKDEKGLIAFAGFLDTLQE